MLRQPLFPQAVETNIWLIANEATSAYDIIRQSAIVTLSQAKFSKQNEELEIRRPIDF
jgi:hypothetical protein